MLDDAAVLLRNAWEKTGHIFKGHYGNVEAITEAHKARAFQRAVDVQHAGEIRRLIRDHPHRPAIEAGESNHNVRRVVAVHFKEVAVVNNQIDHFTNVVWLVRSFRNY